VKIKPVVAHLRNAFRPKYLPRAIFDVQPEGELDKRLRKHLDAVAKLDFEIRLKESMRRTWDEFRKVDERSFYGLKPMPPKVDGTVKFTFGGRIQGKSKAARIAKEAYTKHGYIVWSERI